MALPDPSLFDTDFVKAIMKRGVRNMPATSVFPYFKASESPSNSPPQITRSRYMAAVDAGVKDETAVSIFELQGETLRLLDVKPVEIDFASIEARIMAHMASPRRRCFASTGTSRRAQQQPDITLATLRSAWNQIRGIDSTKAHKAFSWTHQGLMVHAEGLMALGACFDQQVLFERIFGHKVILTQAVIDTFGASFDGDWLLDALVDQGWVRATIADRVITAFAPRRWEERSFEERVAIWRGILWAVWENNSWRSAVYDYRNWFPKRPISAVVTDLA